MNKKVFTMLVVVGDRERMEKVLNSYRIGLNDWDKTKIFDLQGTQLINYTIVCEESIFNSIVKTMNGTRVY